MAAAEAAGGGTVRVGLIGMGFGAQVHLPALRQLEGVRVTALADGGSGRAAALAGDGTTVHADGDALVAAADLDAVVVTAPPQHQARLSEAALRRGLAVYCEKPMGRSAAEADALAALAAARGLTTGVGFSMRYDRGVAALARAVREGHIGRLRRIAVTWTTAGGANPNRPWSWRDDPATCAGTLEEFCSHVFDYCRWIAGAEVERVDCAGVVRVADRPTGDGGRRPAPVPDEAEVRLGFAGGVAATLLVGNAQPGGLGHRIEAYGEAGMLRWWHEPPFAHDGGRVTLHRPDLAGGMAAVAMAPPDDPAPADSRVPAVRENLRAFLGALAGRPQPDMATFADGAAARRVVDAAIRSAAAGAGVAPS